MLDLDALLARVRARHVSSDGTDCITVDQRGADDLALCSAVEQYRDFAARLNGPADAELEAMVAELRAFQSDLHYTDSFMLVGRAADMLAAVRPVADAATVERVARALESQMDGEDFSLPSSIYRERGMVWLEGWFDIRAALAPADPAGDVAK